jgi:GNAT superfamily N-acetyltransferase
VHGAHNRKLVHAVFSQGQFFCCHAGRQVSTAGYRLALGVLGDECVGVGCYRHITPRRSMDGKATRTELLFLAVARRHERRCCGRALVAAVLRDSAEHGSPVLIVLSTGHPFWKVPALGFDFSGDPKAYPNRVFLPWSAGSMLIGRRVTQQAVDDLQAACTAAVGRAVAAP